MKPKHVTIFVLLLFGCSPAKDPVPGRQPVQPELRLGAHTSESLFYMNNPVGMGAYFSTIDADLNTSAWDFGDGQSATNVYSTLHIYKLPGLYKVGFRVQKKSGGEIKLDTSIQVVKAPVIIGSYDDREEPVGIFANTNGDFNLIYKSNHNTSDYSYYFQKLQAGGVMLGNPVSLNLSGYPQTVSLKATRSDYLVILEDHLIKVYNPSGQFVSENYFFSYPSDFYIEDDYATVCFDSLDYWTMYKMHLPTAIRAGHTKQPASVAGMVNEALFIPSPSTLVGMYGNANQTISLLRGTSDGNEVFSHFLQKHFYVVNVQQVSGGTLIAGLQPDNDNLHLIKLDQSGAIQWKLEIKRAFSLDYFYNPPPRFVVMDVLNHIYLFFDNFRCIKLTPEGAIVWDKFYYPPWAKLDAVAYAGGIFIMAGTSQFDTKKLTTTPDYTLRDIILIRIFADGSLLD